MIDCYRRCDLRIELVFRLVLGLLLVGGGVALFFFNLMAYGFFAFVFGLGIAAHALLDWNDYE